ncbi:sigma-54 dependent transcriptional regulator [candidate division KSB1 bacterium]|nr:sigma-54 dependent transcriptional regulator [candidate division KSB1 bacterium]
MHTSSNLYQVFFNTANDAIVVIDLETCTVIDANVRMLHRSEYQREELLGMPIQRLLRSRDGRQPTAIFSRMPDEETSSKALQLINKNGAVGEISINASSVECNGAIVFFVIVRDLNQSPRDGNCSAVLDRDSREGESNFPTIIGQSEKIRQVCRRIGSVAKSEVTVLIQGESGTGKEIVADAIHAHSLRNRGPFVKVNCAALTETLLESELFGHVKGAFTGALRDRRGRFKQADGGTILLDEIGSMSPAGQAKLLRVLQEHEFEPVGSSVTTSVNVRVIAATNTDLKKAVAEGKFRDDLYYRLNVFSISLPPLRERKEDISLLAQHFLHQYNLAVGKKIQAFAAETFAAMMQYNWPGNVRELENAVEHAVLIEKSPAISPASLPMNLIPTETSETSTELGLRDTLNLLEKQILLDTLIHANWIKKRAADMLRIDAKNLPYLLRKHNLSDGLRPN